MIKHLYFLVGVFSVVMAFIGVILPVFPTVPFLILAAFCFSKSSPSLHQKLLNNRYFGPLIRDWQEHGVIETKYKCLSIVLMWSMISYSVCFVLEPLWLKISLICLVLAVSVYIISRPGSRPV